MIDNQNQTVIKQKTSETSASPPLWRNRDYLLLWGGQMVSQTWCTGVAVGLILALTHSPAQAGIVAALRTIPYLVLSLPAGALVDRWDRKQMMIFCDLGRFLCMASVPLALFFDHRTFVQLYLVSFSASCL
jgi:MFS family permease